MALRRYKITGGLKISRWEDGSGKPLPPEQVADAQGKFVAARAHPGAHLVNHSRGANPEIIMDEAAAAALANSGLVEVVGGDPIPD